MKHEVTPVRRLSVVPSIAVVLASPLAVAHSEAVRSLLEIRQENVVVQQWDMSCGAAALATVLTYQLGDPVAEKQVAQGMLRTTDPLRVRHRGGFSLLDMKKYARNRGFQAQGYGGLTLENLRKFAPLIVPVHLESYDHFVVFRGVAAGYAVLADPGFGNRKLPLAEFERVWNGGIGFVVGSGDDVGNRMSPRKTDLLAVEEEVVRAALDSELPAPLNDWQLRDLPWVDSPGSIGDSDETELVADQLSDGEADDVVAGSPSPITQTVNNLPTVVASDAAVPSLGTQTATRVPAATASVLGSRDALPPSASGTTAASDVAAASTPVIGTINSSMSVIDQATGLQLDRVVSDTAPVVTAVSTPVTAAIKPVTATVNDAVDATAPVATAASASVGTVVKTTTNTVNAVVESAAPIVEKTASTVSTAVKPVTEAVSAAASAAAPIVKTATSTVTTAVKPVTEVVDHVASATNTVVAATTKPVKTAADAVTSTVDSVAKAATPAVVKVAETASKPATDAVSKVASTTTPVVETAAKTVDTAAKAVTAPDIAAKAPVSTVVKPVKEAVSTVVAAPVAAAAKPETAATKVPAAHVPNVASTATSVVKSVTQSVPVKVSVPIGGIGGL